MKNIEKIRNMSAEGLGEMVANTDACDVCTYDGNSNFCNNIQPHCSEGIAKWLKQEAEKPSIFELGKFDVYYQIDDCGRVIDSVYAEDAIDIELKAIGNACTDKSVMERKAHDLKLWSLLWNFAEENNGKIDWKVFDQYKYSVVKDYGNGEFLIHGRGMCKHFEIYFSSKELAQRAIDEIVIPWKRGEL